MPVVLLYGFRQAFIQPLAVHGGNSGWWGYNGEHGNTKPRTVDVID